MATEMEILGKQVVDLENEIELLESEARAYQREIKELSEKIVDMRYSAYEVYKMGRDI